MSTDAAARPRGIGPDHWGEVLGIELLEASESRVVARVEAQPRHHQPYGILHGGVYCSIVEAVASHGAGQVARARGMAGVVGVSNLTDFYRSHSRGELRATGQPLHVGRTHQVWEVRIERVSDGKLVARGQVRFHVLSELPAERDRRSTPAV